MKNKIIIIYIFVHNCALSQFNLSTNYNDKVEKYHLGLNSSKLLISNGENKLALINMIEVLKLKLNYGDDALILLSGFIENTPKNDTSYINLLSEYSLLLSECGVKWKEISNLYDIVNKNWKNYKNDSILPNFHLYYNDLLACEIIEKKKYNDLNKAVSKNYNRKLSHELKKIGRLDQNKRRRGDAKSFVNDSIVAYKLKKIIIENEGFPTFNTIRKDGYEIIETCLIHMKMEDLVELTPYAVKSIRNGDMFINEGFLYALDRISIEEGKYLLSINEKLIIISDTSKAFSRYCKSGFGGFYCYNNSNKKQRYLVPISDKVPLEWVNEFRKLIYLPSIEESIQIKHIKQLTVDEFQKLELNSDFRINTYL